MLVTLKAKAKNQIIFNHDNEVGAGCMMCMHQLSGEPGLDIQLRRDRELPVRHNWKPSIARSPSHTIDGTFPDEKF